MLPAVISNAPMITFVLTGSFNKKKASNIVMTTLSLSIGAIRETSPVCNALKKTATKALWQDRKEVGSIMYDG